MKKIIYSIFIFFVFTACLSVGGGRKPILCNSQNDCPTDKICSTDGVCVECETDNDCDDNKICTNNSCVTSGGGSTTYNIGDTGPGGGIVFYDKGLVSNGWQYIEVATNSTQTQLKWQDPYIEIGDQVQFTAIGNGASNTLNIVTWLKANSQNSNRAAIYCDELNSGTKTDWVLPSKDELKELYDKRLNIGQYSNGIYWSSSERDDDDSRVWAHSFLNAMQTTENKDDSNFVRCIRYF